LSKRITKLKIINSFSVLAIIPARGGSKGLPGKNIREICGKPLIAWSIQAALDCSIINRLIVSTEDDEIAKIAEQFGAEIPFMRPVEFAQDDSPGIDPVLHAINVLPEHDFVLLLQPTSPLRSAEDISGIIEFAIEHNAQSVVSVCEASVHPFWLYKKNASLELEPYLEHQFVPCRQNLPKAYSLNGSMYLAKTSWLKKNRALVAENSLAYIMPKDRSYDIDDNLDWLVAERMLKRHI
jgi:CMP-N-acetylneuraminic acid synthetase|tara:strand:- start:716 stop:1429 length:714 start_codon:yes stop_codon:yes gene_type:complete